MKSKNQTYNEDYFQNFNYYPKKITFLDNYFENKTKTPIFVINKNIC